MAKWDRLWWSWNCTSNSSSHSWSTLVGNYRADLWNDCVATKVLSFCTSILFSISYKSCNVRHYWIGCFPTLSWIDLQPVWRQLVTILTFSSFWASLRNHFFLVYLTRQNFNRQVIVCFFLRPLAQLSKVQSSWSNSKQKSWHQEWTMMVAESAR